MRGNFEVDSSGYPIAAMPTGVNKGESTVQDVTLMNKLLDGNVVPTYIATQVAAYLNRGLREKRITSDWNTLNEESKIRYEAIKDLFDKDGNFTGPGQAPTPSTPPAAMGTQEVISPAPVDSPAESGHAAAPDTNVPAVSGTAGTEQPAPIAAGTTEEAFTGEPITHHFAGEPAAKDEQRPVKAFQIAAPPGLTYPKVEMPE